MTTPVISDDPLYRLLLKGKVDEFNHRIAASEKAVLVNCDFRYINLQGINTEGLDFTDSYFRYADLRGVDFLGSQRAQNKPNSNSSHTGTANNVCEIISGGVSNMPTTNAPTII
jgi:hypothetical protein